MLKATEMNLLPFDFETQLSLVRHSLKCASSHSRELTLS